MTRYVPRHRATPSPSPELRRAAGSGGRHVPLHAGRQSVDRRGGPPVALLLTLVALLVAGAGAGAVVLGGSTPDDRATDTTEHAAALSEIPEVERPARPTGVGAPVFSPPAPSPPDRVVIPAIGVDSDLEDLGLESDGALAAPLDYRLAGWFTDGTEPGQPGPAVIAGHVDSPDGPAVFARLEELPPGAEVLVRRADGSDVRFRVTRTERFPKDEFPSQAVYGPVPGAELRLITCDGLFDRSSGHYLDNLIVYATLDATPGLTPSP